MLPFGFDLFSSNKTLNLTLAMAPAWRSTMSNTPFSCLAGRGKLVRGVSFFPGFIFRDDSRTCACVA